MDGRAALTLSLCFLLCTAGCQHQTYTVPHASPNALGSTPPPVPAPSQVKKDSKPKDLPPSVLVSYGDWKSLEAFAPGMDPSRQQILCDEAREHYARLVTGAGHRQLARIRGTQLGENAGVLGAAEVARQGISARVPQVADV